MLTAAALLLVMAGIAFMGAFPIAACLSLAAGAWLGGKALDHRDDVAQFFGLCAMFVVVVGLVRLGFWFAA